MYRKETILRVIKNLPEQFELSDFIGKLMHFHKIESSVRQLVNGENLSFEECVKRYEKMLEENPDTPLV
jgi:hypothetical protein